MDPKVSEMLISIPSADTIGEMMASGIEQGTILLAVPAVEELLSRGEQGIINYNLAKSCGNGQLKPGTSMSSLIGRLIQEYPSANKLLKGWGQYLLHGIDRLYDVDKSARKFILETISKQ